MYKGKKLRLGLGFKFGFFVGLLLITILSGISVFIYNQQREAIAREVTQRGAAIAENLANNASEALTANEELTLFVLAKQAVQEPLGQNDEDKNLAEKIIAILRDDLIQKKQRRLIKNDGILEAVIVRKKDGKIVSASDVAKKDTIYKPVEGIIKLNFGPGDDTVIQEFTEKNRHYYDIGTPILALGREIGEVHLKVSQEVISRVVLANAVKVSLIALAALIAGILFTVLPVNYIINPIKELEKGVKALGEGNYDIVITSYSNDEIGDLTSAFNATAKSLKEKDLLKGAFSAYMPSSVMDEILKDPSKPSLHGNRLKATMLFTDIRGFTSMSDELEPEQLVNVINAYFTVQTDKVFKWKGLFDKFVGNCIMAVFGIPFPQPDDSYRAVRTALDIKEGVDALNEIRQKSGHRTVHIGIGINTGEVFAGNMGTTQKMGYTVIGDNVNLAASLELNAPGGHIYVSESTYIETKDRIEYAKLEPIMVKGKKDPVKVFEPTGLKLQKVINAGK